MEGPETSLTEEQHTPIACCRTSRKYEHEEFGCDLNKTESSILEKKPLSLKIKGNVDTQNELMQHFGLKRAEMHQNVQPSHCRTVTRRSIRSKTGGSKDEEIRERDLSSSWEIIKSTKLGTEVLSGPVFRKDTCTNDVKLNIFTNKFTQPKNENSSIYEYKVILATIDNLILQAERITDTINTEFVKEAGTLLDGLISLTIGSFVKEITQANLIISTAIFEITEAIFLFSKGLAILSCKSETHRQFLIKHSRMLECFPEKRTKKTMEDTVCSLEESFKEDMPKRLKSSQSDCMRFVNVKLDYLKKRIKWYVQEARSYLIDSVPTYWKHDASDELFPSSALFQHKIEEALITIEESSEKEVDCMASAMQKTIELFFHKSNAICEKFGTDCNEVLRIFKTCAMMSIINYSTEILHNILSANQLLERTSKKTRSEESSEVHAGIESNGKERRLQGNDKIPIIDGSVSPLCKNSNMLRKSFVKQYSEFNIGNDFVSRSLTTLVDDAVRDNMFNICKSGNCCNVVINKAIDCAVTDIECNMKPVLSGMKTELENNLEELKCTVNSIFEEVKNTLREELCKPAGCARTSES